MASRLQCGPQALIDLRLRRQDGAEGIKHQDMLHLLGLPGHSRRVGKQHPQQTGQEYSQGKKLNTPNILAIT